MSDENDDIRVNPEMVRGYNDGYLIEKADSKKAKEVLTAIERRKDLNLNNYTMAFKAGAKEAKKEKFKESFKPGKDKDHEK
jgi:flagellar biosynthesis/type III secretory pathway protein FliH